MNIFSVDYYINNPNKQSSVYQILIYIYVQKAVKSKILQ